MPDNVGVAVIAAVGAASGAVLTFVLGMRKANSEETATLSRNPIDLNEMMMSHVRGELDALRTSQAALRLENEGLKVRVREYATSNEKLRARISALEDKMTDMLRGQAST